MLSYPFTEQNYLLNVICRRLTCDLAEMIQKNTSSLRCGISQQIEVHWPCWFLPSISPKQNGSRAKRLSALKIYPFRIVEVEAVYRKGTKEEKTVPLFQNLFVLKWCWLGESFHSLNSMYFLIIFLWHFLRCIVT